MTCYGLIFEDRLHQHVTGELMKFMTIADWTGIVDTESFADTYRSYGLATMHYPVLEITARVEPSENGNGFTLRVMRAGNWRGDADRRVDGGRSADADGHVSLAMSAVTVYRLIRYAPRRNVKVNGQMLQESFDVDCADICLVLLFVEEDVAVDQSDVSLFGTEGLSASSESHRVPDREAFWASRRFLPLLGPKDRIRLMKSVGRDRS